MTIHVHISHDGESLDREFDDTVSLAAFLNIAAYYVERKGLGAMFQRCGGRKSETIVSLSRREADLEPV